MIMTNNRICFLTSTSSLGIPIPNSNVGQGIAFKKSSDSQTLRLGEYARLNASIDKPFRCCACLPSGLLGVSGFNWSVFPLRSGAMLEPPSLLRRPSALTYLLLLRRDGGV